MKKNNSKLIRAIYFGDLASVKKAIDLGLSLNEKSTGDGFSPIPDTPLSAAVKVGDLDKLKLLIDSGALENEIEDMLYCSFLTVACESFNNDVLEMLLKAGANPNIDNGEPLQIACAQHNVQAVNLLLSHGANPNLKGKLHIKDTLESVADIFHISNIQTAPIWHIKFNQTWRENINNKNLKAILKAEKEKLYEEYLYAGLEIAQQLFEHGYQINPENINNAITAARESKYKIFSYLLKTRIQA